MHSVLLKQKTSHWQLSQSERYLAVADIGCRSLTIRKK